MNTPAAALSIVTVLTLLAASAAGQSSSLFVAPPATTPATAPPAATTPATVPAAPVPAPPLASVAGRPLDNLSPAIAQTSLTAIHVAGPRVFQLHDLVTIVVQESTKADAKASIETGKEVSIDGEVSDFPDLAAAKLLRMIFEPAPASAEGDPKVGVDFSSDFEGEGTYKRSDTLTARITAEVVDIKPNGNIVLEARKHIRNDKETLDLTLTGVCRPDDVSIDNTVLSTHLSDLRVTAKHSGNLRKATKKGLITKLFDLIFNF